MWSVSPPPSTPPHHPGLRCVCASVARAMTSSTSSSGAIQDSLSRPLFTESGLTKAVKRCRNTGEYQLTFCRLLLLPLLSLRPQR